MKSLIVLIFAFSAFAGPAQASYVAWGSLSSSCQEFISKTLPAHGWAGGWIQVPEDWSRPHSSRKVHVFYYYDASRDLANSQPILFLNGGPFSSYQNRMPALNKKIQEYDAKKNHVFVMMDQRGTGCSGPAFPKPNPSVSELKSYSATQVAHDAEWLRQAVFPNKKWKLFAQSYGGFLVARYLENYPQMIASIHLHGPTLHESKKDFFAMRIVAQNRILARFLNEYPDVDFAQATRKLNHPEEGKKFCITRIAGASGRLCGQVLLDGIVSGIGQGRGRELGSREIWDYVRDSIQNVMNDDAEAFRAKAEGALSFFRDPSSLMVSVLWGQEMSLIDGSNGAECDAAYAELRAYGVPVEKLPLDECRIIKQAISSTQEKQLKDEFVPGENLLTSNDILGQLARYPNIPFHLYTGELDSLAQVEALTGLIRSPRVNYRHFLDSGHAGWLFEPAVWQTLMSPGK